MLAIAKSAEAVFHDDHRAIDDNTKINRAKAHEITADAKMRHAQRGQQHGERNGQRGEAGGTEIAE